MDFDVESWIWYAVVMWIALSRFISRRLALGSFKAFQLDDYVMALALCFYTTLIVTINIVAVSNSNLLPPGYDTAHMTQEDVDERTYGSKLILVVEECQCTVVWAAKACVLIMYLRFSILAKENLLIKILAGYVAFGYILMEILYLGVWCRPFSEYWAVPTDNVQCDAATNHLITNAVLNLSSDIAMLIIGLPIFIRAQLPLRQKIPVIALFSLGIFVIVSAILNKVYSFSNPFGTEWVFWYVRESSTALIVANLPFVWTLYRRILDLRATPKEMMTQDEILSSVARPNRSLRTHHSPTSTITPTTTTAATHSLRSQSVTMSEDRMLRPNATAEEMLKADYLASSGLHGAETAEINPLTHPALYYAMMARKKQEQELMQAHEELDDMTATPGRSFDARVPSTAASSSKRRSLGSFV